MRREKRWGEINHWARSKLDRFVTEPYLTEEPRKLYGRSTLLQSGVYSPDTAARLSRRLLSTMRTDVVCLRSIIAASEFSCE
uniref:Uncharacterized protein n=1 Tax=Trichuris muris TaxID=70415 RepID=A0A5S6QX25_TRIMR